MRLYNGCPDAQLAAVINSRAAAHCEARRLGFAITYFPMEEQYSACRLSDYASTSPFCDTPEQCLAHIKRSLTDDICQ